MALPEPLDQSVAATAALTTTELFNEGQDAAADPQKWPFARINEVLDGQGCPLCAAVHGMVVAVPSPEYAQWRQPSHINCRRTLTYIRAEVPGTEVTFVAPDAELIRKHGHYHLDPEKHAEYRIPATPEGRHLIVRRVKHLETGEVSTRVDWAGWWAQVPQWKRDLVLKARGTSVPHHFLGYLLDLDIDPTTPEGMRELTLLGLGDRWGSWLTIAGGAADPVYGAHVKLVEGATLQKLRKLAIEEVDLLQEGFEPSEVDAALYRAAKQVQIEEHEVTEFFHDLSAWATGCWTAGSRRLMMAENRLWGQDMYLNFIAKPDHDERAEVVAEGLEPEITAARLTVQLLQREITVAALRRLYPQGVLTLYRGVKRYGPKGEYEMNARTLSSWTTSLPKAAEFATRSGTVLLIRARVDKVFAACETGFLNECLPGEEEFILSQWSGYLRCQAMPRRELNVDVAAEIVKKMEEAGQEFEEPSLPTFQLGEVIDIRNPEDDRFLRTSPRPQLTDAEVDALLAARRRASESSK